MESRENPIGVFDSGVGGLSVLIELGELMPNENFVFVADQKYVPYGGKTAKELVERTVAITDYLRKRHGVKVTVIACNTATCYAIKTVRAIESFASAQSVIPFIGTEPAVKSAALEFENIAVMSTPATTASPALAELIRKYSFGIATCVACDGLEDAVEEGDLNSPKVIELLRHYIGIALSRGAEALVLGCTHYPFLRSQIQEIAGPNIKLFDSGKAIARQTAAVLDEKEIRCKLNRRGKTSFFTTGDPGKFGYTAARLLGRTVVTAQVEI